MVFFPTPSEMKSNAYRFHAFSSGPPGWPQPFVREKIIPTPTTGRLTAEWAILPAQKPTSMRRPALRGSAARRPRGHRRSRSVAGRLEPRPGGLSPLPRRWPHPREAPLQGLENPGLGKDEVAKHVKKQVRILSPRGGFVFQQVHNILADVPPANVVALFDAVNTP